MQKHAKMDAWRNRVSKEERAEPVKYRSLYRRGDRGHSEKRKSMRTAMTHWSACLLEFTTA